MKPNSTPMNDDLLISYVLDEASIQDRRKVEEWARLSEDNQSRINSYRLIWDTSKNIKYPGQIDAQASLQKLKQKAAVQKEQTYERRLTARKSLWLSVAASLLLVAGALWLYNKQYAPAVIQSETQLATKIDTLPDGSIVTLNKHSLLQYPQKFSGNRRSVTLAKGEAFFTVAHNKAKPFFISAGKVNIRVVGTSFNVKYKGPDVDIIVETGLVEVSCNGAKVLLRPGEKLEVKQNAAKLTKEQSSDHLYTYYRSKEFVADNTPLWRMVEVLNEAYDVHIVIGNKKLANLPLNTTFKNESLDDILRVISRTFNTTIEKSGGEIIIK